MKPNRFPNPFASARTRFGLIVVSLGYFENLLSCSAQSTASELSEGDLHRAGTTPGLVRVSAGYTGSAEQRWQQLRRALNDLNVT